MSSQDELTSDDFTDLDKKLLDGVPSSQDEKEKTNHAADLAFGFDIGLGFLLGLTSITTPTPAKGILAVDFLALVGVFVFASIVSWLIIDDPHNSSVFKFFKRMILVFSLGHIIHDTPFLPEWAKTIPNMPGLLPASEVHVGATVFGISLVALFIWHITRK